MESITFIWFVPPATVGSGCACMRRNSLWQVFSAVFGCLHVPYTDSFSKSHFRRTKAASLSPPLISFLSCASSADSALRCRRKYQRGLVRRELFLDSFCLLCYCHKWVILRLERDSPAVAFLFPGFFPRAAIIEDAPFRINHLRNANFVSLLF